jgi:chorismate synthase
MGKLFRVTTFGESHGGGVGAVVEGCPPGLPLDLEAIQQELDRRRPGQSAIVSQRKEADRVEILSGVFEGRTLGSPIALLVRNQDADSSAYADWRHLYRPGHADYTTDARYGLRDWRGGGRASARETVGRVAAGAIARQVLEKGAGVQILAWVERVGGVQARLRSETVERAQIEANPVRCPDPVAAEAMEALIREVRKEGDSLGGVVRAVARGLPAGLGDPVFDKLEADLARAMLSLPAAKGFESGAGYAGTFMRGSSHNDAFLPGQPPDPPTALRTATNHCGGVLGGISTGMPVEITVAFKPVSTIFKPQVTVDEAGQPATLLPRGRHDPCVLPRAVPMVEAMMALVLVDHWLRWRSLRVDWRTT